MYHPNLYILLLIEGPQVLAAPAIAVPPLIRQPIPSEVRGEPKECMKCGKFTFQHFSSFCRHQKKVQGPRYSQSVLL
jgi:hypothetical protein